MGLLSPHPVVHGVDTRGSGDGGQRGYSELSVGSIQFFGKFKHVQKNVI